MLETNGSRPTNSYQRIKTFPDSCLRLRDQIKMVRIILILNVVMQDLTILTIDADHNAYPLGQIVQTRKLLGNW